MVKRNKILKFWKNALFHCFWPILVIFGSFLARSGQLWQVISWRQKKLFQFCKKHLLPHNPNIEIWSNDKIWLFLARPPLTPLIPQWNNEKESQKDGIIVLLLIRLWGGWRWVVEVTNIVPGNFICLLTLIGYKPTVSRDILCIKINRMFPPQKMAKNVQNFICDNIQSISIIFEWEFLWFWFFGFFRFFRFFCVV